MYYTKDKGKMFYLPGGGSLVACSTIILAGGQSKRMGETKALMSVGNQKVLDRLIAMFTPLSEEMILITNEPTLYEQYEVNILVDVDEFKGQGPLAGIYTGLVTAKTHSCFVVACDMPFASKTCSLALMKERERDDYDAVIPAYKGRLHPLFGAYHPRVVPIIRQQLLSDQRKMICFLERIKVKIVEKEGTEWEYALWNMNTREDYKDAQRIVQKLKDERGE